MWLSSIVSAKDSKEGYRLAIEANIVNLSKATKNLTEVVGYLETEEILDLYDVSLIVGKRCETNSQRCLKFYEIILKKNTLEAFRIMLRTFLNTGNESLLRILGISAPSVSCNTVMMSPNSPIHSAKQTPGACRLSEREIDHEQSTLATFVGILIIGFTTSIPIGLFLYMANTYYVI